MHGREARVFHVAVALVALHVVDAEFVQTQPGTSAGGHLAAGLVPLAVAAAAAAVYGRLRPGLRAGIALAFGVLALVSAGIAAAGGVSGSDVTGLLLVPAGVAFLALGVLVPWRERGRWAATRSRRVVNRVVAVVVGLLVAFFGVFPVALSLWTTQKYRSPVGTFAVPHRDVSFADVRRASALRLVRAVEERCGRADRARRRR